LDVVAWAIFLSWLVGRFGTVHIGASQFVWQYLHVSFMPAVGVSIAITAVVGRAIGEGRLDLAARRMRVGLICCCGYMGTMGLIFLTLGRPLVSLFTHDPAVIHVGGHMMICAGIYQVFDGMCIAYNGGLRGAGDNRWPAIVMAVLCWSLVVGAGWLAVRFWPQGQSLGPWITSTVYIIALAIALAYRWHTGRWRQMDLFTRSQPLQPPVALAARPGPAE
jgi:MATE family multidrug resistance protein